MSIFATYAEKAEAAVERNRAALGRANAAIASHDADARKESDDADERFSWKRELRDLEDRRDAAAEALALSNERAELARAEVVEKAAAAERAAIEKEARANEALVHEIARDVERLRAKLDKLAEHVDRAKAAGVEDAEVRVRRGASRTLPAITQTVTAWFGPDGTRYGSDMTHDAEGRSVKATDRVQGEVVDVIRAEVTLPGEMPERFADAIKLVRLDGRSL